MGKYIVKITNVELPGPLSVFIKGKYRDGSPWIIELPRQSVSDGVITSDYFTISENAGCTMVVAYGTKGHLAADREKPQMPGHMKTFYDDEEPFNNPIPCKGEVVPEFPIVIRLEAPDGDGGVVASEFPIGPEVIAAVGLLAFAIRRKQKP